MEAAGRNPGWLRSENVRIAIVTGLLSLLAASIGAYVGGRTANDGAMKLQDAAAQREYERDTAEARASARLLIAELQEMELYAALSLKASRFQYTGTEVTVEAPRQDLGLISKRLSTRDWNAVALSVHTANVVERRARQLGVVADLRPGDERAMLRRLARQDTAAVRPTVRFFLTDLRAQDDALKAGIAALRPLARGR